MAKADQAKQSKTEPVPKQSRPGVNTNNENGPAKAKAETLRKVNTVLMVGGRSVHVKDGKAIPREKINEVNLDSRLTVIEDMILSLEQKMKEKIAQAVNEQMEDVIKRIAELESCVE